MANASGCWPKWMCISARRSKQGMWPGATSKHASKCSMQGSKAWVKYNASALALHAGAWLESALSARLRSSKPKVIRPWRRCHAARSTYLLASSGDSRIHALKWAALSRLLASWSSVFVASGERIAAPHKCQSEEPHGHPALHVVFESRKQRRSHANSAASSSVVSALVGRTASTILASNSSINSGLSSINPFTASRP